MAFGRMSRKGQASERTRFFSRKTPGDVVFDIVNVSLLVVLCITVLYPFWYMLMLSFSSPTDASTLGFHIWLKDWVPTAYRFAFSRYSSVDNAYINTIFRTIVGTFLTLIVVLLAAYPLSKKQLPGRNIMMTYILITMFFSGGLIPTYLLVRSLGLLNTRASLIAQTLANGFYIIVARNFLMTIDPAYEESAFMDGASYFQVFARIVLPLSKPLIATIALWTAVYHWNEWFLAMIYTRKEQLIVLQLLLKRLIDLTSSTNPALTQEFMDLEEVELPTEAVKSAVAMLTIGPIILFYPFIQRYFVKGVFVGSVKG